MPGRDVPSTAQGEDVSSRRRKKGRKTAVLTELVDLLDGARFWWADVH